MLVQSWGGGTAELRATIAAPITPVRYRTDIDGLRAVAILPILLLHCGVRMLRGGFVGVDIFFVISGFLITGILTRDIAADRFSLISFYRHRIVRILPALLAMMVIVLIVGGRLLLPNQLRDLGLSTAATSLFVSNHYFYATSDYFAVTSDAKPLVHTWSLAVEEQFYLLYPLLLLALRHLSRPRLARVIGGMAVASLAIGCLLAFRYPSAAFFLLPARIWELSLGALVALGAAPAIADGRLRAALCWGALAVIATSVVAIGNGWPFPIPFAIPPAAAAAILIAYGANGPTARLLSLAPVRAIGFISYSLYLWHRPIIAFYENSEGQEITAAATIALVGASFAMALLSYLLIERPAIQHWRRGTDLRPHAAGLVALVGGAAIGFMMTANADAIRPLPANLAKIASYLGNDTTVEGRAQFGTDRCFVIPTGRPFEPACLRLSRTARNIVLIGDSHAAHFSQALRQALPNANIVQATAAGCRPLLHGKGFAFCRDVMDRVFHGLDFGRVDTVILSGRWMSFEDPNLLETIRYLQDKGVRVMVIGPSVEYRLEMPTLLVRTALSGDAGLPDRFRLTDRFVLDHRMETMVRAAGGIYFSATRFECPLGKCRLLTTDGVPYHFDHSHFTPDGARELIASLVVSHALVACRRNTSCYTKSLKG